jgi:response regulator of citrate/malate metabolism
MLEEGFAADALMTDFYLPDSNGLELIEIIRSNYSNLQLVMVTGHTDPSFIAEINQRPYISLLFKPLQLNQLKNLISGQVYE